MNNDNNEFKPEWWDTWNQERLRKWRRIKRLEELANVVPIVAPIIVPVVKKVIK